MHVKYFFLFYTIKLNIFLAFKASLTFKGRQMSLNFILISNSAITNNFECFLSNEFSFDGVKRQFEDVSLSSDI